MTLNEAIKELHSAQPGRDFIVISAEVSRELHSKLTEQLREKGRHDKCTVFLTTFGGDPHGGYRVARCLRHHYKHVRLVIPSFCKSAGTLIAISADQLAIGDLGELGPLDIQVSKPSEIQERSSGLDIIQALEIVMQHAQSAFRQAMLDIRLGARLSTKLAGEFASNIAVGIAGPLYAQIDPNRLGEMQRAMKITHEYGMRLNIYASNLKSGALNKLVAGYPSHSFVIDRKEAKDLFNSVGPMTKEENNISQTLWSDLSTETDFGPLVLHVPDTHQGESNGQGNQGKAPVKPKPDAGTRQRGGRTAELGKGASKAN